MKYSEGCYSSRVESFGGTGFMCLGGGRTNVDGQRLQFELLGNRSAPSFCSVTVIEADVAGRSGRC